MAEFLGFQISRIKKQEDQLPEPVSFTAPPEDDGAVTVAATGGFINQYVDLEGTAKNEAELVTRYRKMAMQPECEVAIDDIVNEAIVNDPNEMIVNVNLDRTDLSASIKKRVRDEFQTLYNLLAFGQRGYDVFRNWYIDGRMYYHAIVDESKPEEGIVELRYIDPRKIRKVREVKKVKEKGVVVTRVTNEFFMYNDKGFNTKSNAIPDSLPAGTGGTRIAKEAIVHITSGLLDENNKMVLSHLHKAIKPLNQLQVLEDAAVIYRISRAPERRIFYIDVGNLPKMKAEQYLADMMTKHKNRLVYDASDGSIRDDRKFMTMLEDFWLPRREGGRGTEITSLPGGQNLGEMDDVEYFKQKLFRSLNVPISRLQPETNFALGRASEVSRDEVKFNKFIRRLRVRFSMLFDKCMEKQLILKGVMTLEEWQQIRNLINYDYIEDNHFSELKNTEIMNTRMETLTQVENYVGKYFSKEWVMKNLLRMNDEEMEAMQSQIEQERAAGEYDDLMPTDQDQQNPNMNG